MFVKKSMFVCYYVFKTRYFVFKKSYYVFNPLVIMS